MNLLLNLTCLTVILSLGYSTYRAWNNQKQFTKYIGMLDDLLPKLLPNFGGRTEDFQQSGEVVPSSDFGQVDFPPGFTMPSNSTRSIMEFRLRSTLEQMTMEILKAHTFSISYEKAWGMAETIYLAEDTGQAKPLSEALLKTLPTEGSMTAPVPDSQAQAVMQ